MRESKRYFFGGSKPIFPVENHAMAAIEHHYGRARALVFSLMNVQVRIFEFERQLQPFALEGGKQRSAYVQIHDITKFVRLGSAACVDARSQIARIVSAEARFAE